MKRTTALFLAFIPAISNATPFDLLLNQRNIADTATITRQVQSLGTGFPQVLMTDPFTGLPVLIKLGNSLALNMATTQWTLEAGGDWTSITNKPIFATVATSGNYNDLINKPSFGAQVNSDWNAVGGVAEVLNKPTTLAGYGITDAYPLSGNPSAFLTGITGSDVTTALGFAPYSSSNPSSFVSASGARSAVSLTTTGTSGAATYNSATGVLNVPVYAAPARSQASATRALNTAFQISATRDALAFYSVQTTVTASIGGGQDGDVFLDIASDSGFTTNVQSLSVAPCSQTYTLAIAIQGVQKCATNVSGFVPAGYYARLRTVNNTGTPAYAVRLGQEILQ